MDYIFILVAVLIIVGVFAALYEWASRRSLMKHNFNIHNVEQSKAERDHQRNRNGGKAGYYIPDTDRFLGPR